MKKSLYLSILSLLFLSACSNEQNISSVNSITSENSYQSDNSNVVISSNEIEVQSSETHQESTNNSPLIYEDVFQDDLEEQASFWSLSNGVINNELIQDDKTLKITGNSESKSNNFSFKKITGDFKISFNLVSTSSSKNAFGIKFYDENGTQFTRLKFDTTKIKYSNSNNTLGTNFKENYWHDIDFIFHQKENAFRVDFYYDGTKLGDNLALDNPSVTLKKINFYTDSKKTGYSYYVNELSFSRDLSIVTNAPSTPIVEEEPLFPSIDEVGEKFHLSSPSYKEDIKGSYEETQVIPSNAIFCTPSDFEAKIKSLTQGQTLVLEDGIYNYDSYWTLMNNGSKDAPIVVMARHVGKAIFHGSIQFQLGKYNSDTKEVIGGNYYLFNGLKFTNGSAKSSGIFKIYGSHCRFTNIIVDGYDKGTIGNKSLWIQIMSTGKYCEVDHSTFINKNNSTGVLLFVERNTNSDNDPNFAYIHNNYFGNYINPDPLTFTNELETIRIGVSGGEGASYSIVENNIFENISSEPELISIKSKYNLVKGNVIIKCISAITLRQGSNNIVKDNIILNEGIENGNGIRVFGHDQVIENNLISGVPYNTSTFYGGLVLHNGSGDNVSGSGQCTTNNSKIINNTFINNYFNICLVK